MFGAENDKNALTGDLQAPCPRLGLILGFQFCP